MATFCINFNKDLREALLEPRCFTSQWIWAIVADFIPIGILAFCNTRLIWELRRATSNRRKTAHGQKIRDSSHKVTLTPRDYCSDVIVFGLTIRDPSLY